MKSILNLFKKCEKNKEEKNVNVNVNVNENVNENHNFDNTRTSTEINKLLYKLDDELHSLNISEEKKMKIMKNYKVNLDNDNIPSVNTFNTLLAKTEIPSNHIERLEEIYKKQVIKKNRQ